MTFRHKISWEDFYGLSGGEKQQKVEETRRALGYSDRQEFERETGRHYLRGVCSQLWRRPQINFDGRLLGCCVNHWSDFGNVLQHGLETPKLACAKEMLQGKQPAREDWLKPEEVVSAPYSGKDRPRRQIHPDLWGLLKDLKGLLRRCGFTFWP